MVKKLPIIGLLIGAVAAAVALLKRKKTETKDQDTGTTM